MLERTKQLEQDIATKENEQKDMRNRITSLETQMAERAQVQDQDKLSEITVAQLDAIISRHVATTNTRENTNKIPMNQQIQHTQLKTNIIPKNVNIGATGSAGNTAHPENAPINQNKTKPKNTTNIQYKINKTNDGMNDYIEQNRQHLNIYEKAKHFKPVLGGYPKKYRMESEEGNHMSKEEIKLEQDEKNKVPWRINLTRARRWFAISKKGYFWDRPRPNTNNPIVFDRVWVEPTANKEYFVFDKLIRYSQWFEFNTEDYNWWNNYKRTEEGQIHDLYLLNLNREFRNETQEVTENTQITQEVTIEEEGIQVTVENNQEEEYNQNYPELGFQRVKKWDNEYKEWNNQQNISFLEESRIIEEPNQENQQIQNIVIQQEEEEETLDEVEQEILSRELQEHYDQNNE